MAWSPLSIEAVEAQLGATELAALRTIQTTPNQADPLEDVLAMVVAQVRSYLPALRGDPTVVPGLLPESLHGVAMDIVRHRLCTRLAVGAKVSGLLHSEPRQKAYEHAVAYLRDVARGLIAVEPPPVGGDSASVSEAEGRWGSAERFDP